MTESNRVEHPPRPALQRWGAILWPAFLLAGVATMVFFAFVDPEDLASISFPGRELSRELGYSLGFFMFWALTTASSALTWLLLRPASRFNAPLPPDQST